MSQKLVMFLCLVGIAISDQMTYNDAAELAQININLPSTTFPFGSFEYIRLSNGVMVDHKGAYLAATLSPRIVNADFNNDTYTDAAVLLDVVHDAGDGLNYTTTHVFIVLQDYANGPRVSWDYPLAKQPTAKIDIFSSNA